MPYNIQFKDHSLGSPPKEKKDNTKFRLFPLEKGRTMIGNESSRIRNMTIIHT